MTYKSQVIYTSELDLELMTKILKEDYLHKGKGEPTLSEVVEFAMEDKDKEYEQTMDDLDVSTKGRIMAYGLIHRNGEVKRAFRIFSKNLSSIMYSQEGNLELRYSGADVVAVDKVGENKYNYYTYRELKEDTNYKTLLMSIYYQKVPVQSEIDKYTKPLDQYMYNIYGWERG